nr:unnamed protein product [Digitaria exilis]
MYHQQQLHSHNQHLSSRPGLPPEKQFLLQGGGDAVAGKCCRCATGRPPETTAAGAMASAHIESRDPNVGPPAYLMLLSTQLRWASPLRPTPNPPL